MSLDGSGSDLSEESVLGCEPAALDTETFPSVLPGPSQPASTTARRAVRDY